MAAPAPTSPHAGPRAGLVREALRLTFRRIIRVYFRAIESTGNVPAEDTRGRLFVSNHVNALVDPILVLTSAPCAISPIGKSTLWNIPGLRWLLDAVDAVPIVRKRDDPGKPAGSNEEVFDRIADSLAGGQNILIFPEGVSHNEPRLLEPKTGAARMLARAAARGGRGLTFQAVALEFDERDVFRSRCLLLYGPVHRVDELASRGDALVTAITERVRDDLSELLVEGATWPERLLIARVAEMLASDTGDRSLARWNSIGRQVEAAQRALRGVDEATVVEVAASIDRYYALLAREGLVDAQLAEASPSSGQAARALGLLLVLPLSLLGIALYALPYPLPRLVARRSATSGDEVSTLKLGAGLLVHPLWAAALITAACLTLPWPFALAAALLVLTSPFAALALLDVSPEIRRSFRLFARRGALDDLRAARREALDHIHAVRARLGM